MRASITRRHLEADVVVIGYGAAGAVAAITAHDSGARVLILEKQKSQGFMTSSFMSGGGFICPNDIQGAIRYMEALYKVSEDVCWTEPDIIRVWARYTSQNKEWLESMGGVTKFYRRGGEHKLPGFESIDVYHHPERGPGLMELLYQQVHIRGIEVMHDAPAIKLMVNSRGEVIGVQARTGNEGKVVPIKSRRAVILTTGGFEFDEQMKLQYLMVYPTYFLGSPANTGDGIRMALGVGAQLWHMNCCSGRLVMKFPELPNALNPSIGGRDWISPGRSAISDSEGARGSVSEPRGPIAGAGYIVVDRLGKRYTRETFKPHTLYYELVGFDSQRLFYPRIPSYWIFDQKRMEQGPLVQLRSGPAGPAGLYHWSADNQKELERAWIKKGDTVEHLAQKLGMDPGSLPESLKHYNLCCQNREDKEFQRPPATLFPLNAPPYYAVELWPGGPNTQGGPRRNSKAQVLRADGSPVPRLYSAGELGSIYGMLYPAGGGNLAECIAFGRIAGENASEYPPW